MHHDHQVWRGRHPRYQGRCFAALLAFLALAGCTPEDSTLLNREYPNRTFQSLAWDTVVYIGSDDPDDTTFLRPTKFILWEDDFVILDGANNDLRMVSSRGEVLWSYHRPGQGPGEIGLLADINLSPSGLLWVVDNRNWKLLEFSRDGLLLREVGLQHLPTAPVVLGIVGERVYFANNSLEHAIVEVDPETFAVLSTSPLPWPYPVIPDANISIETSAHSGSVSSNSAWAIVLVLGPGFMVMGQDTLTHHHYIDPIPWSLRGSQRLTAMRADSARFGARAVNQVEGELFMLFGGRPQRGAHDRVPKLLIDVYDLEGSYRRSYRLPSGADYFRTDDGRTFYLLSASEVGSPILLGIRPVPL